ncbi:MAG TPA: hypothetical protein PKW21_01585 [Rhabdaerophilum sp.]|nr:hypothetical protein [Rhabdaerophilum sp.]
MLAVVVLAAELAALMAMLVYVAVLTSMHREAKFITEEAKPDPVGRSLTVAARWAFYAGVGAVIALFFLGGLLQWPTI